MLHCDTNNGKICKFIFRYFSDVDYFLEHKKNFCQAACVKSKIEYPLPGEFLRFKNPERTDLLQYIGFFDLEAILEKDPTNDDRIHIPVCVCCVIIDTKHMKTVKTLSYVGLDCVDVFLDWLITTWAFFKTKE